ncbi:MAG: LysR family transcriptional regulator [Clostridium sp.]|nr:LysR family transcriptional regulator [Clostridium sp.]
MNINDFKYITTIAELGSYNAAAKALYMTQPSLTQRIKYIEQEYGITIFNRNHQGTTLTSEGKIFLQYAIRILEDDRSLRNRIDSSNASTTIRLGIPRETNAPFFINLILSLIKAYPHIHFLFSELNSVETQKELLSGKIDFAICYLPIISDRLTYRIICNDQFVLVPRNNAPVSKYVIKREPISLISPQFLDNEPISVALENSLLRNYTQSIIDSEKIRPEICNTLKSLSLMYAFALDKSASAIMYESYLSGRNNTLPYFKIDSPINNQVPITISWSKDSCFSTLAESLFQTLKEKTSDDLLCKNVHT